MSLGIRAHSIGPATRQSILDADSLIGVPFTIVVPTDTTNSTYTIYSSNAPKRFRVYGVSGVMTAAGAALDTVVVNNASSAITNTIDVSALQDTDTFVAAKVNDANWQVSKGGSLNVVTVSSALCTLYIHCVWLE